VVRLVSFGAFVELEPGVEGLVHISRIADYRVEKPEDVLSVGQEVKVKILGVHKDERRISLSIRDARSDQKKNRTSNVSVGLNLGEVFGEVLSKAEQ
jgi:ribosomal protein S1